MPQATDQAAEARIRSMLERWAAAVRAQDADGVVAHCTPDVVWFDALLQLRYQGLGAYRDHWRRCFSQSCGALAAEIHDLDIAAGGDAAFCRCAVRLAEVGPAGEIGAVWLYWTVCLRRRRGGWQAVQEHFSLPAGLDDESTRPLRAGGWQRDRAA